MYQRKTFTTYQRKTLTCLRVFDNPSVMTISAYARIPRNCVSHILGHFIQDGLVIASGNGYRITLLGRRESWLQPR